MRANGEPDICHRTKTHPERNRSRLDQEGYMISHMYLIDSYFVVRFRANGQPPPLSTSIKARVPNPAIDLQTLQYFHSRHFNWISPCFSIPSTAIRGDRIVKTLFVRYQINPLSSTHLGAE